MNWIALVIYTLFALVLGAWAALVLALPSVRFVLGLAGMVLVVWWAFRWALRGPTSK